MGLDLLAFLCPKSQESFLFMGLRKTRKGVYLWECIVTAFMFEMIVARGSRSQTIRTSRAMRFGELTLTTAAHSGPRRSLAWRDGGKARGIPMVPCEASCRNWLAAWSATINRDCGFLPNLE